MPYIVDNTKPWLGKAIVMSIVFGVIGYVLGLAQSQTLGVSSETSPSPIETTIEETPIVTTQPAMPDSSATSDSSIQPPIANISENIGNVSSPTPYVSNDEDDDHFESDDDENDSENDD